MARSRWIDLAGRAGYVTRGLVFLVTGLLSILCARGRGGDPDPEGAIEAMVRAPLGRVAVLFVAIGLFVYSAWCLVQALFDPEGHDRSAMSIAGRVGQALSAAFYLPLARLALRAAIHGVAPRQQHRQLVRILELPGGRALLGAIGVGVIVTGIIQLVVGVGGTFEQELDFRRASRAMRRLTVASGALGFGARALVFGIVGVFLVLAAIHVSPARAHSVGGALREVLRVPYGSVVVDLIGVGLLLFGAFSLLAARYHRAPR